MPQTNTTMENNGLPQIDYNQFCADTRITILDMMPELVAYSILWHNMEYGNDPITRAETSRAHVLGLPFALKIRDRLRAEGRWPEDKNLEYSGILTSILMVKAASLTPDKLQKLRDVLTHEVFMANIF